jgi:hypothetical protein
MNARFQDPELNEQAALATLHDAYGHAWRIWRPSRRSPYAPGSPSRLIVGSSWCATLLDQDAGVDATVVRESAQALFDELRRQELLARERRRG